MQGLDNKKDGKPDKGLHQGAIDRIFKANGIDFTVYRDAYAQDNKQRIANMKTEAVSYTHLTLPTIYSV